MIFEVSIFETNYPLNVNTVVENYTFEVAEFGQRGQPSISAKIEFTAVENQTEFSVPSATAIVFFTRNGIEIALNSRFIADAIVYYVPIENNNETIKQNDRIIITYL